MWQEQDAYRLDVTFRGWFDRYGLTVVALFLVLLGLLAALFGGWILVASVASIGQGGMAGGLAMLFAPYGVVILVGGLALIGCVIIGIRRPAIAAEAVVAGSGVAVVLALFLAVLQPAWLIIPILAVISLIVAIGLQRSRRG